MSTFEPGLAQLRTILEHLRQPVELDDHPWAMCHFAQDQPGSSPGEKLVLGLRQVFRGLMPGHPPRQGKRLDTRWGAFGLLAARYFAPLEFGQPIPKSQREAWLGIDQAILLYVFGAQAEVSPQERARYSLVGNEPEIAPNSTLSGWNRKGLAALLELVSQHEASLVASHAAGATPLMETSDEQPVIAARAVSLPRNKTRAWKVAGLVLGLTLLAIAAWGGWQAYQVYQQARLVMQDAQALKAYLSPSPQVGKMAEAAGQVSRLRADLEVLQTQVGPYLWLTPRLGWVPRYGGDLTQAASILDLAGALSATADEGLQAILPALGTVLEKDKPLDVLAILNQLQTAQPRLLAAQVALAQAQQARQQIRDEVLSEQTRGLLQGQVDPLLRAVQGKFRMDDALLLVKAAPSMLGVGKAGPKTYLLLIQNEDELRPTGGFITAVGSVVIKDGKLWDIKIEAAEMVDDFNKPYPQAPWQLNELMNLPVLVFRDSNWYTDFPTAAGMAEYFYSYTRAHSVDGVIAIDQQVVIELLKALGPIRVEGVVYNITSQNVLQYMRTAKQSAPPGVIGLWDRKQFIGRLAKPLLEKMLAARGSILSELSQSLVTLLDRRHILLQFDDPDLTTFLARFKWDGAVKPPAKSDFLMVVDTNMSYNKSNAVMETALTYDVDLSQPAKPAAKLKVVHSNHATGSLPCALYARDPAENKDYPINECHWTYLRVYDPAGTSLITGTPHAIPAEETMLGDAIPARIDELGNEDIPGVQAWGTLVVIPEGKSVETGFEFGLPAGVLEQTAPGQWTYRLTVQKQPGTKAVPLALRLVLPGGAKILHATEGLSASGGAWLFNTNLTEDVVVEVSFSVSE